MRSGLLVVGNCTIKSRLPPSRRKFRLADFVTPFSRMKDIAPYHPLNALIGDPKADALHGPNKTERDYSGTHVAPEGSFLEKAFAVEQHRTDLHSSQPRLFKC